MRIVDILKKLISFRTVSGDRKEADKMFSWIRQYLKGIPVYITKLESGGFPSLVISTRRTKKPKLCLMAHLDVVPGSPDVFKPYLTSRRIYGRGAMDMKFAGACYLALLKDLRSRLKDLDLCIMFTTDEEVGGRDGTNFLLKKGYRPQFVFLPDGRSNWELEIAAKGAWHFEVEATGKAAHGSSPWQGDNAIMKLTRFITDFHALFRKEPCGDPLHHHPTINVGMISGGKALNQVPDYAMAGMDIRHEHGVNRAALVKKMKGVLKKHPGIKIKELLYFNDYQNNLDCSEVKRFRELAHSMYGIEMKPVASHGTTDARFLAAFDIPRMVTSPKGGDLHTEKEWMDIKDLERFYKVLKVWTLEMAGDNKVLTK